MSDFQKGFGIGCALMTLAVGFWFAAFLTFEQEQGRKRQAEISEIQRKAQQSFRDGYHQGYIDKQGDEGYRESEF
jgi:hypothetical protein